MTKKLAKIGGFATRAQLAVLAVVASVFSPLAMAAGEAGTITAVFDEYKTEALIVIIALAVVLWTMRGAGLLKPKG